MTGTLRWWLALAFSAAVFGAMVAIGPPGVCATILPMTSVKAGRGCAKP